MSNCTRRRQTRVLLLLTFLCVTGSALAQTSAPSWYFEDISAPPNGCVTGTTLAGFDLDPLGQPVAAWREDNVCGLGTQVFWSRQEHGVWQRREFVSPNGSSSAYRFAIRPSDGNPFMLYNGMGLFFEVNAYLTDLGQFPNGGSSTFLENIVPPQNCSGMNSTLSFGPADLNPQRAIGIVTCNGQGPLRLNGSDIRSQVFSPRPALAVGADGTRHLLWNTGTETWYSRVPAGAIAPDREERLFTTINRFGGEVAIAVDAAGVIHAVIRGADATADWDPGATMYARSIDGGATWSAWEYVDFHDDPNTGSPWHVNTDISLAVDGSGTPSVTFWRSNSELWYARRDGLNDTWTYQLVTALPFGNNNRDNQLRFDAAGAPVIAFSDPVIQRVRLARPIPAGVTAPVDVSVTLQASHSPALPGSPASFKLTVINNSAVNLPAVNVSADLPDGVSFIDANPPLDLGGGWTIPLTSGASRAFTVNVTLPATEGTVVATARARTDFTDATPEDNAATAGIQVRADPCCDPDPIDGIDIAIALSAAPAEIAPTGIATFVTTITNRGNVPLTNVPINLGLSGGASLVDIAPPDTGGDGNDRHVILATLAPGESKFIVARLIAFQPSTISVTVNHGVAGDVVAANDNASASVVVKADACYVVPSDLVSRWRGDGNGNDAIGGHTAVLRGHVDFAEGRLGRAFRVLDQDAYVEVPDDTALKPAAFTIAGWINASNLFSWNTLIAKGASGSDPNMPWFADTYWLGLGWSGYPTLYTYHPDGTTVETIAANPISTNRWYHLAATYDGSVARVYLDGAPVAERTINQPLYYDTLPVPATIGQDWQGGSANGAPFVGRLDDVLLYSRALSADDVLAMVAGSSSACPTNHDPIAVDDVIETTVAGASANVVANDSDPDGDTVTIVAIVTPPSHGTASFNAQSITYTPNVFDAEFDALTYRISDGRGGFATATLTIMLPVRTSISLQSSPQPSARGAAVTLTAHVTALAGAAVPDGSVTFHNVTSNTPLASAPLVAGTATLTVDTLPPGTNLVRASYAPIGRFLPSSIEIEHVVISVDDVIRNGDIETGHQYDAVGAIVKPGGSCSATLLSRTVALTAAQCVYNLSPQDLQFRIGADLSAPVASVLVHPGAVSMDGFNLAFDVALVRLDAAAVAAWPAMGYSAIAEHEMFPGAISTAVGAASIGGNWVRASGSLLVTQYIAGEGPIGNIFADGFIETLPATAANHMFCTRGVGGPLFDADGRITGVASFRFVEPCAADGAGYYLNLVRLRDWITTSASALEINIDDVIRNGDIETRHQYDGVGAIEVPGGSCSATLLSPTVALTAAQCVHNWSPQDLQFRIGADLSAAVETVLIHPGAVTADGFNLAFDVALVRLDAAAVATWPAIGYPEITEHATPIQTIGTAVGAASIGGSWVRASGSLLVTQYITGEGPIGNFFEDGFIETLPATAANHMFCTRGVGGPLFDADGRMTGVASFRFVQTCAADGPGYYVSLERLRDWITTSALSLEGGNRPPVVNGEGVAPVTIAEDSTDQIIDLNGAFSDADGDVLTLSASGATNILSYSMDAGVLTIHPQPDANGVATIAITAMDPSGASATADLIVTITPVNDAPRIAGGLGPISVLEDSGRTTLSFGAGFLEPDGDPLTYGVSAAAGLFTFSVDATTLALDLLPDANGTRTVGITAYDPSGANVTNPITVNVTPVNDPPTLNNLPNIQAPTLVEAVVILDGLGPGAANEQGQALTITAVSNAPLVTGPLTVIGNTIHFTPPARAAMALASITVTVADDGGTANGGSDRISRSFIVTVPPTVLPNVPPTIDPVPAQTLTVGEARYLALHATDPDGTIISWEYEGLPAGWALLGNGSIGSLDGVIVQPGVGVATIRVIDSRGGVGETTFAWTALRSGVDLALSLSGVSPVRSGETASFDLTITNFGSNDAVDVSVEVSSSALLFWVGGCNRPAVLIGPAECRIDRVRSGETRVLHGGLTVGNNDEIVTATAAPRRDDHYRDNDMATFTVVMLPRTLDLAVTLDAPATVNPNATFSVTLTARNVGNQIPSMPPNARVTVPTGSPLSLIGADGCEVAGRVLSCALADFLPGQQRSFTVWLRAGIKLGNARLDADVSGRDVELTPLNNSATEFVQISGVPVASRADLEATVTAPPIMVLPSGAFALVRITNLGPDVVEAYQATITLDGPGISYPATLEGCSVPTEVVVDLQNGIGGHSVPVGPITCTGTFLAPGATFEANVPLFIDRAGLFTVTVDSTTGTGVRGTDPPGNNHDSASITSRRPASDLAVSIAGPASAQAGQPISYSVTVINLGPDASPSGSLQFGAASADIDVDVAPGCERLNAPQLNGSHSPLRIISCPLAPINAGASTTFPLTAHTPDSTTRVSVSVKAQLLVSIDDPTHADKQATFTTQIQPAADLQPGISRPDRYRPGSYSNFTVVAANTSRTAADNVRVTVSVGPELIVMSVPAGCVFAQTVYECSAGRIPRTSDVRFSFGVMPAVNFGTVTIQASMTTVSWEVNTGNNSVIEQVGIFAAAPTVDLEVTSEIDQGHFLFFVANTGTNDATSLSITVTTESDVFKDSQGNERYAGFSASFGDCVRVSSTRNSSHSRNTFSCTGAVTAGGRRLFRFDAQVIGGGSGGITGTVTLEVNGASFYGAPALVRGTLKATQSEIVF